jgi:hypothetical protein
MALRQESAVLVTGEEHFTDTLAALLCSARPDHRSGDRPHAEPVAPAGPMPGGPAGGPVGGPHREGVAFGWESLTPTERSVAAVVAEGTTNR